MSAVLQAAVGHLRDAESAVHQTAEALSEAPQNAAVLERYTQAVERAEELAVWDTDTRIESTVTGLGLETLDRQQPMSRLSGGQRARLAMASLLLSAPDVLLLDEPTNHLDDAAVQYLQTVIASWHGPVVMVSHDRAFLDETVVSILDLDPAPRPVERHVPDEETSIGVTRFSGTYSQYLASRRAARRRWQQRYDEEQTQLRHLRATVDEQQVVGHRDWKPRTETRAAAKFYADRNAKVVARRVSDARSRLAALEQHQIMKPPAELTFQGLSAGTERSRSDTAQQVYEHTVGSDLAARVPLATFGLLTASDEHRHIETLSIGQQRRLTLAMVLADPPDVLLLDEPTNHLSLVLATQLEGSIAQYPGAVVVASHDRWLRHRWQGRHLAMNSVGQH